MFSLSLSLALLLRATNKTTKKMKYENKGNFLGEGKKVVARRFHDNFTPWNLLSAFAAHIFCYCCVECWVRAGHRELLLLFFFSILRIEITMQQRREL